jgi:hypothetical protein
MLRCRRSGPLWLANRPPPYIRYKRDISVNPSYWIGQYNA